MHFPDSLLAIAETAEASVAAEFAAIDHRAQQLTRRVLEAFCDQRVDAACFDSVSGYGYNDRGRETLDRVFAQVFGCEKALVRHNFVSGTHALAVGLAGLTKPGDTVLFATGEPYDTLSPVVQDLTERGVRFTTVSLSNEGTPDSAAILAALTPEVRVVYFQRSRGYSSRPTVGIAELKALFALLRPQTEAFFVVDNCYGEFCADTEPSAIGADLCIGSLIKNAGGGMCETGGYLAGTSLAVDLCADRLTAPGLGAHVGATLAQNKAMFKGLFYAPHTTAQALKSALFASALFDALGYSVSPRKEEAREDIIQSIHLGSPEKLLSFCAGLQAASPIDSFASPVPGEMPGYEDEIIMAAGTFTQGASIELSADAPMRAPYTVFVQGALTYESAKIALLNAASFLLQKQES